MPFNTVILRNEIGQGLSFLTSSYLGRFDNIFPILCRVFFKIPDLSFFFILSLWVFLFFILTVAFYSMIY